MIVARPSEEISNCSDHDFREGLRLWKERGREGRARAEEARGTAAAYQLSAALATLFAAQRAETLSL